MNRLDRHGFVVLLDAVGVVLTNAPNSQANTGSITSRIGVCTY